VSVARLEPRVREVAENAAMAARLGRDLPGYLRMPLTLDQARARVRWGLERREARFLAMATRAVYGHARSPYRRLLAHVGCELGDLEALVAREGLEGALAILAARGVYVSFDEFKGRRPAVRGSARFTFSDRDFDNPLAPSHYLELTGGSRGRPTRVGRSLGSVTDTAASFRLVMEAHGLQRPRNLFWLGGSLSWALVHLKLGHAIDAWLYPIEPLPRLARGAIGYVAVLARLAGHRLPPLEYCDLREARRIAGWLASRAGPEQAILVNGPASSAVRVATAAVALGRSLEGVTFHCRSEPLSRARRRLIEASGARALPDYAAVEVSSIAYACAAGIAADDLHLCLDRYAVIERRRAVVEGGPSVDAMLFTPLSPDAPKVGFNVELGDSARIEERDCGCLLGELGLRTHLSEIRSFEKLSSEGTSFARGNVVEILDEALPGRFGGGPLDYQLLEEEGPDGAMLLGSTSAILEVERP
jgi:hypothetical protein